MLERQKAWQQRWRERHEREGTLYDAVAVVKDISIGRSVLIMCGAFAMLHDTAGIQTCALHYVNHQSCVVSFVSKVLLSCRCIGATNKALAKRQAAEDVLRIIAEKEAAVAAAAVASSHWYACPRGHGS